MSDEESPDLTKSWVFVDSEKKSSEDHPVATSGVEDVSENDSNQLDSDTDSISVISESGCSYKTDEEEFAPAATTLEEESSIKTPETTEVQPSEPDEILQPPQESETIEKLLYVATSAACALVLIGFSILVQHYFYTSSDVNKFAADFEQQSELPVAPYVQSVKSQDVQGVNSVKKSYSFKRKNQPKIEEKQIRLSKNQKGDLFHDKISFPSTQIKNNDLTVEDDVKSNYKLSKNKSPATKFNKENCDDSDKRAKNDEFNKQIKTNDFDKPNKDSKKYRKFEKSVLNEKNSQQDDTIDKKIKELKIREAYLKEKEKYLLEKEHHLMKKEIKLNKEKDGYGKKKYDKKSKKDQEKKHSSEEYEKKSKRGKENKHNSEEHDNKGKKDKFKPQKKYYDEKKDYRKYKNKEEKKRYYDQNYKIIDESQHKKRNISGQWYIDMHKARNNIRQKEHASDWVFDRAHIRSLKRNKAHWYFQWMVDRARLRVK